MLNIKINNMIIKFYLTDIDFVDFLRIQQPFIKKYGFKYYLTCLYYVRHKNELEQLEYEEALKICSM